MNATIAHRLAALSEAQRRHVLSGLSEPDLAALEFEWSFWARPDQLPPDRALWPSWRTWLMLGGRGSGKTRSAAEWVRAEMESGRRRQIGILGQTADAMRRTMVEGVSGLLSVSPSWCRPSYEPSTRRIVYPNGGLVHLFTSEEPNRLRGPNLDGLWIDELTSMSNASECWDMAMMALRIPGPLGDPPVAVITTTPRALKLLRAIIAAPTTITTRAKTSDNASNLDVSTLAYLHDKYGGTRLGRQELDAELLLDIEGALWNAAMLDEHRRDAAPHLRRVVVGVDPAGASGKGSAETGIVVAGKGADEHGYVIDDASLTGTPEQWARRACGAYHLHKANYIVVEKNFGGEMVENTIKSVDRTVAVKTVSASRGKALRAEPIVSLYEQGRIHHVGNFPTLEDQMTQWDPNGSDPSPDRLDALVWACSELLVKQNMVSQYFGVEATLANWRYATQPQQGGAWPNSTADDWAYSKRARGEL